MPTEHERDYQPIEAYGLLGNCEGCALVARDGAIDWACLERFDADPSFSRLLDRRRGGYFALRPAGTYETSRQYLSRTNILQTTFTTEEGFVVLHDFMVGPEGGEGRPRLVRLVIGLSGRVTMLAQYRPLAGFAERFAPLDIAGGRVTAEGCPGLLSDAAFALDGEVAVARFPLAAGESRQFALYVDAPPQALPDAHELMEAVRRTWALWTEDSAYVGPLADDLMRSALVLKALTYEPTGAIVAAATTSLPEEIGGVRNWDYRFCWIRDACLSFYVLKKFGMSGEADAFFGYVSELCAREEGQLKPLYSISGEADLDEAEIKHFEGWRGSSPVHHGNGAAEQHQSDAYGQVLDLIYLYERLGGTVSDALREHAARLADISAAHWHEPDAGLWEPRKPERRYLHAAIMNWVALDRAIHLFGARETWVRERDRIVAFVNGEAVHADGYYPQYLGTDDVDAALLVAPMVGFPVDETVFARTVDVVQERLGCGHLIWRYKNDDGLPGEEGSFLLCAFWMVDALLWLGREQEARTRFAALRSLRNDIGLFPEQIDREGGFLGNFPQAFSHLGFIHSALVLDLYAHGGREAVHGTYADRTLRETDSRSAPVIADAACALRGPEPGPRTRPIPEGWRTATVARIGYHASHEQHAPSELLRDVQAAQAAGFSCAMSSEHFQPWSRAQGQSGHAWSWLGAALATTQLPFGIITAPGYRHHPAVLAQSAATLAEMFPERLWLALGSGQRLNEGITGLPWPEKAERNATLDECAAVIRALLAGETVTHRGRVTVVEAKLYSRPARAPRLVGGAVTPQTARRVAAWADGLVTVGIDPEKIRPVIEAFREGGGAGKPVYLQTKVCWDPDPARALAMAHEQWRCNMLEGDVNWELRSPVEFETAARFVRPEDVHGYVRVSDDLGRHADWLAALADLGPEQIIVHQVAGDQARFAEAFGARVLPQMAA